MTGTLSAFFHGIDEHRWENVRAALADSVLLDSSAVGRPAMELPGDQLVSMSRSVGGGFQQTLHHFGNIRKKQEDDKGEIEYDLMALHYLPVSEGDRLMVLFRTINTRLFRQPSGRWVITTMVTRSEKSTGNNELLTLVRQKQDRLPSASGAQRQLAEEFFSSLKRKDEAAFDALWTDDASWRLPFLDRTISGKSAIREYFKEIGKTRPAELIETYYQDTDNPEITLAGYTCSSGPGLPSAVNGAVFYFRDGRIEKLDDYLLDCPLPATPV